MTLYDEFDQFQCLACAEGEFLWWETQKLMLMVICEVAHKHLTNFDIEGCDECVDNSPCIASLNVVLRTILLVLQVHHHHHHQCHHHHHI